MSGLKKKNSVGMIIKIILSVCIIAAGYASWNYFKSNEIKMKRKPPRKQVMVVETIALTQGTYQSSVHVMGTVKPEREITIKSRVSGEVISISPRFVIGGIVKKGEPLLQLDDSDYQIEIKKAQSTLDKVLSDYAIEEGSQKIAKEEVKLMNQVSNGQMYATDLSLRKPQLAQAKAAVGSARADLEKAELNLARTRIMVPFNALVLEKHVEKGSLVSSQGILAKLVDIDTYHVEAQVPPDRLQALSIGGLNSSQALIRSLYSDQTWTGRVVRTTGKMTEKSRMAGVIISIFDPLGLKSKERKQPLLLDDHVAIQIMGKEFESVFSIPRSLIRENDTLWVYHSGTLDIKKIHIVWKEDGVVFVRSDEKPGSIKAGDLIITSDLPAPVKGMGLQMAGGKPESDEGNPEKFKNRSKVPGKAKGNRP